MSRYKFDKFDFLSLIPFHSRESFRAFDTYTDHLDAHLIKLRKEDPVDRKTKFWISEKIGQIERFLEKFITGKDEIEMMFLIRDFCDIISRDNVRTRLQVRRLISENKWLRSELQELQKRLLKLEDYVKNAEAEKVYYQYIYKMRNSKVVDHYVGNVPGGDDDDDSDPEEEVPSKVKPVHNLCIDYIRDKRYEVALPLAERALMEAKAKLGENSNEVATLYSIMGKIYKEQGNFAVAQECYDKCLKIREKVLGKEHNGTGITLTNLARVMYKRKNFKDAEKNATQALKIREKALGKTHYEVALIHTHLGTYYISLEKWNDCVNHYKIAMGIYEQMFDSTDNLIIKGYASMAKAYVKLKQNDKSAEMLGMICQSYQKKNSVENPNTIFQVAQNSADGKIKDFSVELLMGVFGSYENVLDLDTLGIMADYFINLKKPEIAETLKQWSDFSHRQPTTIVRQSMVRKSMKKSNPGSTIESTGSSFIDFFKKSKK